MVSNVTMGLYKLLAVDYIRSHSPSLNVISVSTYQRSVISSTMKNPGPMTGSLEAI